MKYTIVTTVICLLFVFNSSINANNYFPKSLDNEDDQALEQSYHQSDEPICSAGWIGVSESPQSIAPTKMITPNYISGPEVQFEFEFRNYRILPVNQFKYELRTDNKVDTVVVSDLSLAYQQVMTSEIPNPISPGLGFVSCTVTVIEVNGAAHDGSEDALSEEMIVYETSLTSERHPLVETFTSSTCGPCLPGNQNLHNILDGISGQPVVLKWQQNFPGAGDPYCTEETIERRNYYGINAIPNTNVDATYFDGNTNVLSSSDISGAREQGALVDIQAIYERDPDEQSIRVSGTLTASVGVLEGSRLMIAVRELRTDKNVGTNGETEFLDVVKKVLPGTEGITLPRLQEGEEYTFDETYTFPGDYRLPENGQPEHRIDLSSEHTVEEFTDLAASIWVEDREAQFILGAENADQATSVDELTVVEGFTLSPNPVQSTLTVEYQLLETRDITYTVYDISGRAFWSAQPGALAGYVRANIPVTQLNPGAYLLRIQLDDRSFAKRFIKR